MASSVTDSVQPFPDADEIVSSELVEAGFDRLAASLQPKIDTDNCILLGVLNGGLFALVRLADRLQGDFQIDYCHATRYEGGLTGQGLEWVSHPQLPVAGRNIIVVDDIFDEGLTMQAVAEQCRMDGAARVETAVMAIKDRARAENIPEPDYSTGIHVPDRYVFGCGMDLHEHWRHLPAIYALRA